MYFINIGTSIYDIFALNSVHHLVVTKSKVKVRNFKVKVQHLKFTAFLRVIINSAYIHIHNSAKRQNATQLRRKAGVSCFSIIYR